jgi:hypothetical protein
MVRSIKPQSTVFSLLGALALQGSLGARPRALLPVSYHVKVTAGGALLIRQVASCEERFQPEFTMFPSRSRLNERKAPRELLNPNTPSPFISSPVIVIANKIKLFELREVLEYCN